MKSRRNLWDGVKATELACNNTNLLACHAIEGAHVYFSYTSFAGKRSAYEHTTKEFKQQSE